MGEGEPELEVEKHVAYFVLMIGRFLSIVFFLTFCTDFKVFLGDCKCGFMVSDTHVTYVLVCRLGSGHTDILRVVQEVQSECHLSKGVTPVVQ